MNLRIALFEPDIPQNTGTILRLGACLDLPVDIIQPCGFPFSDKALRRSTMDYADHVDLKVHDSWEHFWRYQQKAGRRTVLLSTKACATYHSFEFGALDTLLFGRESAGVPEFVHDLVADRIKIPMSPKTRSLNVAMAAAMVSGEALRQLSLGGSLQSKV